MLLYGKGKYLLIRRCQESLLLGMSCHIRHSQKVTQPKWKKQTISKTIHFSNIVTFPNFAFISWINLIAKQIIVQYCCLSDLAYHQALYLWWTSLSLLSWHFTINVDYSYILHCNCRIVPGEVYHAVRSHINGKCYTHCNKYCLWYHMNNQVNLLISKIFEFHQPKKGYLCEGKWFNPAVL